MLLAAVEHDYDWLLDDLFVQDVTLRDLRAPNLPGITGVDGASVCV